MDASQDLIVERPEGLYCPSGDFYIDPWRPVGRSIITHAHANHSRFGHASYIAAEAGVGVLLSRLPTLICRTFPTANGVAVSLYRAGHVPGSAQVRVEHAGNRVMAVRTQ